MYELLGIHNKPLGTKWDISLDYLSKRGFGYGTNFKYDRPDFFGIEGHSVGMIDFWASPTTAWTTSALAAAR